MVYPLLGDQDTLNCMDDTIGCREISLSDLDAVDLGTPSQGDGHRASLDGRGTHAFLEISAHDLW